MQIYIYLRVQKVIQLCTLRRTMLPTTASMLTQSGAGHQSTATVTVILLCTCASTTHVNLGVKPDKQTKLCSCKLRRSRDCVHFAPCAPHLPQVSVPETINGCLVPMAGRHSESVLPAFPGSALVTVRPNPPQPEKEKKSKKSGKIMCNPFSMIQPVDSSLVTWNDHSLQKPFRVHPWSFSTVNVNQNAEEHQNLALPPMQKPIMQTWNKSKAGQLLKQPDLSFSPSGISNLVFYAQSNHYDYIRVIYIFFYNILKICMC